MDVVLMADQNVAEQLKQLHEKQAETQAQLKFHERLHQQNADTLLEVKNVLIENARTTEQIQHMNRRFDAVDARLNSHSDKIQANHQQLIKWGAVLSALAFAMTVGKPYITAVIS